MTNTWAHRVEAATLAEAGHHRDDWSHDDLLFVAKHADHMTDEELAYRLGRSYYAIASIKQVIEERLSKPARLTERQRIDRAPVYTFVGNDVPPGW